MLAHFLHLLDQAPCPFHTLCLNFTEFQYFSSSFLGSRSATASCPASGSASASRSTGTSPILGRADFYLQSILFTSQKGAFQLRSNFLRTGIFVLNKPLVSIGQVGGCEVPAWKPFQWFLYMSRVSQKQVQMLDI